MVRFVESPVEGIRITPGSEEALAAELTRLGWVTVPPDPAQEDVEPEGITPDQLDIAAAYIRRFGTEDFQIGAWAAERLADVIRWAMDEDQRVTDYEAYEMAQDDALAKVYGEDDEEGDDD